MVLVENIVVLGLVSSEMIIGGCLMQSPLNEWSHMLVAPAQQCSLLSCEIHEKTNGSGTYGTYGAKAMVVKKRGG